VRHNLVRWLRHNLVRWLRLASQRECALPLRPGLRAGFGVRTDPPCSRRREPPAAGCENRARRRRHVAPARGACALLFAEQRAGLVIAAGVSLYNEQCRQGLRRG
jgi:hypothetical protein